MPTRSFSLVLIAACAIFGIRIALVLWLVPPWQQPDEPAHVAIAEVWRDRFLGLGSTDPGRENEILHSMSRHAWWKHYGSDTPAVVPPSFAHAGDTLGINPRRPYPAIYYATAGALLSLSPPSSVVGDLRTLRLLSAAFSLLTIYVGWKATRVALGESAAAVVTLLLALHPQFVLVSTSAGPDPLVNLLGACAWWQLMRALTSPSVRVPLLAAWTAAGVAAATDRMGVPLVLFVGLASVLIFARRGQSRSTSRSVVFSALALLAAMLVLAVVDLVWGTFRGEIRGGAFVPVPQARNWAYFERFTAFLFQSWWASIGWVRYFPSTWWFAVVSGVAVAALAGLVKHLTWDSTQAVRKVVLMAALFLAAQLGAEYWAYFRLGYGPQGKHLFPAIIPSLMLLWLGLASLVARKHAAALAATLVLVFAVLDAAVWIDVIVPAYWRS